MPIGRLLPPLAGAVCFALTGPALAQGHGTPNAPEAGPASPGAESHSGEGSRSGGAASKDKSEPNEPPQGAAGTDAGRKAGDPKR